MANAVTWVEIPVKNFDRAKKFYEYIFGIEIETITDSERRYGTFPYDMGSGGGCSIVEFEAYEPAVDGPLIYLNGGEDLNVPLSKIEKAHGRIITAKTDNGDFGFIARFFDSEGNVISLHSWD